MQAVCEVRTGEQREARRHELASQHSVALANTRMASLGSRDAPQLDFAAEEGGDATIVTDVHVHATGSAAAARALTCGARASREHRTGVMRQTEAWLISEHVSVLTLGHQGLRDGMVAHAGSVATAVVLQPRMVVVRLPPRAVDSSCMRAAAAAWLTTVIDAGGCLCLGAAFEMLGFRVKRADGFGFVTAVTNVDAQTLSVRWDTGDVQSGVSTADVERMRARGASLPAGMDKAAAAAAALAAASWEGLELPRKMAGGEYMYVRPPRTSSSWVAAIGRRGALISLGSFATAEEAALAAARARAIWEAEERRHDVIFRKLERGALGATVGRAEPLAVLDGIERLRAAAPKNSRLEKRLLHLRSLVERRVAELGRTERETPCAARLRRAGGVAVAGGSGADANSSVSGSASASHCTTVATHAVGAAAAGGAAVVGGAAAVERREAGGAPVSVTVPPAGGSGGSAGGGSKLPVLPPMLAYWVAIGELGLDDVLWLLQEVAVLAASLLGGSEPVAETSTALNVEPSTALNVEQRPLEPPSADAVWARLCTEAFSHEGAACLAERLGDGSGPWPTGAARLEAVLAKLVLQRYAIWHGPGERLASQAPPGWTRAQLFAQCSSTYRLPRNAVARYAISIFADGASIVVADPLTFKSPVPRGASRAAAESELLSHWSLKEQMDLIRCSSGYARDSSDGQLIERAFRAAKSELVLQNGVRHLSKALLPDVAAEVLLVSELETASGLRLVTLVVLGTIFCWRTHELLLTLFVDFDLPTAEQLGAWRVPGYTKTHDGVEGAVHEFNHASGCSNEGASIAGMYEQHVQRLQRCACPVDAHGRLRFHGACPVCLCVLLRRRVGAGAAPVDGLVPLFQGINGVDGFNGRIAHPVTLLDELRGAIQRANVARTADGKPPHDPLRYTLYSLRHGGIMGALMSGLSLEWVAERRARIAVRTLLVHYRSHALPDTPFETNGRFGEEAVVQSLTARAASEGYICSAAEVEALLRTAGTSLGEASVLSRRALLEMVVRTIAGSPRHTAAGAALLRSHAVRQTLMEPDGTEPELPQEESEFSMEQVHAFVRGQHMAILQRRLNEVDGGLQSSSTEAALQSASAEAALQPQQGRRLEALGWRYSAAPTVLELLATDSQLPAVVLVHLQQAGWRLANVVSRGDVDTREGGSRVMPVVLHLFGAAPGVTESLILDTGWYGHDGPRGWSFVDSPRAVPRRLPAPSPRAPAPDPRSPARMPSRKRSATSAVDASPGAVGAGERRIQRHGIGLDASTSLNAALGLGAGRADDDAPPSTMQGKRKAATTAIGGAEGSDGGASGGSGDEHDEPPDGLVTPASGRHPSSDGGQDGTPLRSRRGWTRGLAVQALEQGSDGDDAVAPQWLSVRKRSESSLLSAVDADGRTHELDPTEAVERLPIGMLLQRLELAEVSDGKVVVSAEHVLLHEGIPQQYELGEATFPCTALLDAVVAGLEAGDRLATEALAALLHRVRCGATASELIVTFIGHGAVHQRRVPRGAVLHGWLCPADGSPDEIELPSGVGGAVWRCVPCQKAWATPLVTECLLCGAPAHGLREDTWEAPRPARRSALSIFARTNLSTELLPPVLLLAAPGAGAAAAVAATSAVMARLDVQEGLSGRGSEARRRKEAKVQTMDLFLQVCSSGHVGLLDSSHLHALQARSVFIAAIFMEMVRPDGAGPTSRLAFPRGGYQSVLLGTFRRAEARQLVEALELPRGEAATRWLVLRGQLEAMSDDDPRLVAAQRVVTTAFARLVEAEHDPVTGTFRGWFSSEDVRTRGRERLKVGLWLVRRLGVAFGCPSGQARWSGDGAADEAVGWSWEGPRARPAVSTMPVPVYHASVIRSYRSALSWYLRQMGWPTVSIPARGQHRAYEAVCQLQQRGTVRATRWMPCHSTGPAAHYSLSSLRAQMSAYFTSIRLATKQCLYRAMAATEDVMEWFFSVLDFRFMKDLMMADMMQTSYVLGWRRGSLAEARCSQFEPGGGGARADVLCHTDASKVCDACMPAHVPVRPLTR